MKYLLACLIAISFSVNSFSQNTNSIEVTKTLITQGAWAMDEFYIDSLLSNDADINALVLHFYENGNFSRGKNDVLFPGMFWELQGNDQLKVTCPEKNYTETLTIVSLLPDILVTHQSVIGIGDGKSHILEARYKRYTIPTQ